MTLHQLEVFALVAKLGSFTKAAGELHIGQPSVSSLMVELQKELGIKLFEKLGIKTHLTEAGKRFLQKSQNILTMIKEAKEEIDDLKGFHKGKISIGGCGLATDSGLPSVVQTFKKAYPGVEIGLTIEQSSLLEKSLLEGDLDLAILSWPSRSNLLVSELWREEELIVIASPDHPLAKKRAVSLALLVKEPLIANLESHFGWKLVEQKFAELGVAFRPTVEVKTHSRARDAIKNAVLSNLGIGFLAKSHIVGDLKSGRLKTLRVPQLKLTRPLYITVPKNRKDLPLTQAFTKVLRDLKSEQ